MTTVNPIYHAAYGLVIVTGVVFLLAACSSDSNTNRSCEEKFSGMTIPASAIGLPTSGAVVTEAVMVKATNAAGQTEYCRVSGDIRPVDPAAPMIKFQVGMPNIWNSKAMMFGGGGFNGKIPSPESNVYAAPLGSATPLDRGYATFGSDSGHQNNNNMNAEFALNDEALQNFSGDALKKTRDVAMHLIKARYGVSGVAKSYFAGGSTGGREALAVVQRWPQDWDGAIILFPAWNYTTSIMHSARGTRHACACGARRLPQSPETQVFVRRSTRGL